MTLFTYKPISEGIEAILNNKCKRTKKTCFRGAIVIPVGSMNSGLRIGYPYEADYLLVVDNHGMDTAAWRSQFGSALAQDVSSHDDPNMSKFKFHRAEHSQLGMCWYMEYFFTPTESIGVQFDIIPAYRVKSEVIARNLKLSPKAEKYLKRRKLHDVFRNDIMKLFLHREPMEIAEHSDGGARQVYSDGTTERAFFEKLDTGLSEQHVFLDLSEDTLREIRIAKYLLQQVHRGEIPELTGWNPDQKAADNIQRLYGYNPLIPSYLIRAVFWHIWFEGGEQQWEPGTLALRLLQDIDELCDNAKQLTFTQYLIQLPEPFQCNEEVRKYVVDDCKERLRNVMTSFFKNVSSLNL